MSEKIWLFTFVSFAIFATMASASDEDSATVDSNSTTMLNKPLIEFTGKIFRPFASSENVLLSPISIHKALSMVLIGADKETQTKEQLLETLGLKNLKEEEVMKILEEYSALIAKFKNITKESVELYKRRESHTEMNPQSHLKPPILDIFNMVITKDLGEIQPAYVDKVKKYFHSSVVKVDDNKPETKSDVLSQLNGWAKEAGFKAPIMQQKELDEKFSAYLMSAIRVQGFWFEDFTEHEDKFSPAFYNRGKKDKPVKGPVLYQSKTVNSKYLEFTSAEKAKYKFLQERASQSSSSKEFTELSELNMHVVEVPLQGGLSFAIFEPLGVSGAGGELDKLVEQLLQTDKTNSTNKLEKAFSLLDSKLGANPIDSLRFPKFGFENELDLKGHLQSIGLTRAFDRMNAQISSITSDKLFIEKISHQAMIDVNKFGIKAAGVTKIKMMPLMAVLKLNPIRVVVENPFLFVIRYGKLPLFIGRLDKL